MTKKIALAAAMIHSPRLLVLDEPFESVDPVSAANIIEILQRYTAAGGTVVLSSHGMDLIQRVCDSVAIIVRGQVLAAGTIDEVRGCADAGGALRRAGRRSQGSGGHGVVAQFLGLKLRLLGNAFRRSPWQVFGLVIGLLYGGFITVLVVGSLVAARVVDDDVGDPQRRRRDRLGGPRRFRPRCRCCSGSTTRSTRGEFSLFGIPNRTLAIGLLLAGAHRHPVARARSCAPRRR